MSGAGKTDLQAVVPHADSLGAVDLAGDGEDGDGLAGAWRAVEEKMGDATLVDELVDWTVSGAGAGWPYW